MGKPVAAGKLKLLFMAGMAVVLPNWNTPAEGFGCGAAVEGAAAAPKLKLGVALNPGIDCCCGGWAPNIEEDPKAPVPKGVVVVVALATGSELPNGVAFKSPKGAAEGRPKDAVVVDPNVKGA